MICYSSNSKLGGALCFRPRLRQTPNMTDTAVVKRPFPRIMPQWVPLENTVALVLPTNQAPTWNSSVAFVVVAFQPLLEYLQQRGAHCSQTTAE